jgi:hypothetical protein
MTFGDSKKQKKNLKKTENLFFAFIGTSKVLNTFQNRKN